MSVWGLVIVWGMLCVCGGGAQRNHGRSSPNSPLSPMTLVPKHLSDSSSQSSETLALPVWLPSSSLQLPLISTFDKQPLSTQRLRNASNLYSVGLLPLPPRYSQRVHSPPPPLFQPRSDINGSHLEPCELLAGLTIQACGRICL